MLRFGNGCRTNWRIASVQTCLADIFLTDLESGYKMDIPVTILSVEQDDDDGIWVRFSDGTVAGYLVRELLDLRPYRDLIEPKKLAN